MALIPCRRINNLKWVKSFKEVEKLDIIKTSALHQGKMYLFDEQENTVVYCPGDQSSLTNPPICWVRSAPAVNTNVITASAGVYCVCTLHINRYVSVRGSKSADRVSFPSEKGMR
jgi:hypothetical protein